MGILRFAGAFAVRQLADKVNAGAKLPECTACPDLSESASL
ncbi:MAG: hypothetical protein H6Q19_1248 [Bacteroidetes bacterium]|nr:hypothetical protein [Bacteroidota bacterium]